MVAAPSSNLSSSDPATIAQAFAEALTLHQNGRLAEAETAYRRILDHAPDHVDARHHVGLIALQQGDLVLARSWLTEAAERAPNDARLLSHLAVAEERSGQRNHAEARYRQALAANPGYASAAVGLAGILAATGERSEALRMARQAETLIGQGLDGWINLAGVYNALGEPEAMLAACQKALALAPDHPGALFNLSLAQVALTQVIEAEQTLRRLVALKPDWAAAHDILGTALRQQGRNDEALTAYQTAARLHPEGADSQNNLGSLLRILGRIDEGIGHFRRAVALDPGRASFVSNLAYALNYAPEVRPAELLQVHRDWDLRFGQPAREMWQAHANAPDPERRLRVGYVSADLRRHPVGYFLLPSLRHRNRQEYAVVVFSTLRGGDDLTAEIRGLCDQWHEAADLDDRRLVETIREANIDILVDLAGHTQGNRLLAFARKPAPVQATWAGYVGTTGLSAIDWLITDSRESPPGSEAEAVERLMCLPDGYVCYEPPFYAPPVGPLPMLGNGVVTFGCFNNLAKLNSAVIDLWARLLRQVAGARLLIKTGGLGPEAEQRFAAAFAARGIEAARLMFSGLAPHRELLDWYNRVDIALDPFPYSGGLTTLEALWMGVPVVTKRGDRFSARHSASHVTTVGHPEWIGTDDEDYLRIATRLAADPQALATLRSGLREAMRQSPACDGARFARHLEAAYRAMWVDWCARKDRATH